MVDSTTLGVELGFITSCMFAISAYHHYI